MTQRKSSHFFVDALKAIRQEASEDASIAIGEIFAMLAGRGYAALLILFSFPVCLPIQIPGFSIPIGLLLGFLGLRLAFAKHLWWPEWVLQKEISSTSLITIVDHLIAFFESKKMHFLHPRWPFLFRPFFHRLNGILVFLLAAFLALPLPIPLTNLLSAFPILALGLGLLEDDGLFILIGYGLFLISAVMIAALFIFGAAQLSHLFSFLSG